MEGLSTKAKSEGGKKGGGSKFLVWVSTGTHEDAAPQPAFPALTLVGSRASAGPLTLNAAASADKGAKDAALFRPGKTNRFSVTAKTGIGQLQKVRVRLEGANGKSSWYLKSVKVKDATTEDEGRVGLVESWVEGRQYLEIPVTWPDLPPNPLVTYEVRVETSGESGNESGFSVSLNLVGEKGDTGHRALDKPIGTAPNAVFKPYNVDAFEVGAVSVGELREAFLLVEAKGLKKNVSWLPSKLTIFDPHHNTFTHFVTDKPFVVKRGATGKEERALKLLS